MRGASHTMVRSRWRSGPPRLVHALDCEFQELVGRRAAPARIVRREMLADIAIGNRAEDGVDQRVERDVGVRMPGQPTVVWNLDAAKPDMIAVAKSVHIEAVAETEVARLAIRRDSALAKSSSVVSFTLPLSPEMLRP
jgi:hypothetical protein